MQAVAGCLPAAGHCHRVTHHCRRRIPRVLPTRVYLPACSVYTPQRTNLRVRSGCRDRGFLDFLAALLVIDPEKRPTAAQALRHPWLATELPFEPYVMPQ